MVALPRPRPARARRLRAAPLAVRLAAVLAAVHRLQVRAGRMVEQGKVVAAVPAAAVTRAHPAAVAAVAAMAAAVQAGRLR